MDTASVCIPTLIVCPVYGGCHVIAESMWSHISHLAFPQNAAVRLCGTSACCSQIAPSCQHNCLLRGCRKHKRKDAVTEQHMGLLLSSGLLTRHLTQKDAYWFALAGIGPLVKSLVKGRKVYHISHCHYSCRPYGAIGTHKHSRHNTVLCLSVNLMRQLAGFCS